jgi:hypothetical protein
MLKKIGEKVINNFYNRKADQAEQPESNEAKDKKH